MLNTLADNARKFTEEGGSVHVSAQGGTDYVELSVTDTGKGMSRRIGSSVQSSGEGWTWFRLLDEVQGHHREVS